MGHHGQRPGQPGGRRHWHEDIGGQHRNQHDNPWAWATGGEWGAQGHRRGRGPGGPGGPPPWVQGLLGWGPGRPEPAPGPKVRRGDVRTAILDVVREAGEADEPINGYQVIQQIAERSDGAWRPSPGSVYPTVQQLHDEGLVESDDDHGRKTIRLTEQGRRYVEEHRDALRAVWEPFEERRRQAQNDGQGDVRQEIAQVMSAVWQIVSQGSESQRGALVEVLVETRRRLYGILADGPRRAQEPDPDES